MSCTVLPDLFSQRWAVPGGMVIASPRQRSCAVSPNSSQTSPAKTMANSSVSQKCARPPLLPPGRIVINRGSSLLPIPEGPNDSMRERNHPLCSMRRSDDLIMLGVAASIARKNWPKVTPSLGLFAQGKPGMERPYSSTCEMKLAEKPHLLASDRAERRWHSRIRRKAIPRDCSNRTLSLWLAVAINFRWTMCFNVSS